MPLELGRSAVDWNMDRGLWRALFLGYGAAVLWFASASVGDLVTDLALQHNGTSTTGIYGVTFASADALRATLSTDEKFSRYSPQSVVSFLTADGSLVAAQRGGVYFGPWLKSGERVEVDYDPQDPTRAIVAGQPLRDHAVWSVILVVLGVTTVIPALRSWITGRS